MTETHNKCVKNSRDLKFYGALSILTLNTLFFISNLSWFRARISNFLTHQYKKVISHTKSLSVKEKKNVFKAVMKYVFFVRQNGLTHKKR
jgi:hypothetical protein